MSEYQNPYQAPQSELADNPDVPLVALGHGGEPIPADKGVRFATYLLDLILGIVPVGLLVGFSAGLIAVLTDNDAIIDWMDRMPDFVVGAICMMIYYVPMEALFGRTVGKFIMGTRVVNEEGGKPSVGQVLGRSFCRVIPFEAFSFLGETGRGWHDSIPKTYVVKCR